MYVDKEIFTLPKDKNINVWRYMSFTKFVDLLNTQELFFSRPDNFNDPFEGSLTKPTSKRIDELFSKESSAKKRKEFGHFIESFRRIIGINCWHMNPAESNAMWKLYLNNDDGVAIQSSFIRLAESFKLSTQEVSLACINYVDYETHLFRIDGNSFNFFELFTHKRNSFVHENELRAIVINTPASGKLYKGPLIKEIHDNVAKKGGDKVKVDINHLIENIYISPFSQPWFKKLICDTISRFGYDFNIKNSSLQDEPMF